MIYYLFDIIFKMLVKKLTKLEKKNSKFSFVEKELLEIKNNIEELKKLVS